MYLKLFQVKYKGLKGDFGFYYLCFLLSVIALKFWWFFFVFYSYRIDQTFALLQDIANSY